jgi:hypothetical protein
MNSWCSIDQVVGETSQMKFKREKKERVSCKIGILQTLRDFELN